MNEKIEKLILYQITNEISEEKMCEEIGITRRTFSNLKKERMNPHVNTLELIDSFIEDKEL